MLAMLFANLDIKLMHSEEDSDERILIRDESISSSKIIVKSNDSSSAVSFTPSPTQPVLVVLQQIMPIIHKVALVWVNDAVVIDVSTLSRFSYCCTFMWLMGTVVFNS